MDTRGLLKLNPLLTDRTRLAIMATLAAAKEALDFNTLLETLGLSRGNLSAHLRKLEDAKLVQVKKGYFDRKPRTTYRCNADGRAALREYLEEIEQLLKLHEKVLKS